MRHRKVPFFLLLLLSLAALPALAGAQDLPWRVTRIPAPEPGYGFFGSSVALSGDTLAVSAVGKNLHSLVVYVYVRDGEEWVQQARLRLANPQSVPFPPTLVLSGDTLAVGRAFEYPDGGSVFIFSRHDGTWTREARLRAVATELFGGALALSGDTLAVGAIVTFRGSLATGSVIVFRRQGGVWGQEARLSPRELTFDAQFGHSVALEGDRLAVGAHFDIQVPGQLHPGSVWIYNRRGTRWQLERRITGGPGRSQLGESVSLSGDTLAVGAFPDKALIFEHRPEGWRLQACLTRSGDPGAYAFFGFYAAVSGAQAVVLGNRKTAAGRPAFGAYLFEESDGVWLFRGLLDEQLDLYSNALAIEGRTIVLGSARTEPSGAVHVFTPE